MAVGTAILEASERQENRNKMALEGVVKYVCFSGEAPKTIRFGKKVENRMTISAVRTEWARREGRFGMKNVARELTAKRVQAFLLIVLFGVSASAQAGTRQSNKFPNIKISNFGQMDEHLYRGEQPNEEDYKALAEIGIKVIVDLRNDPQPFAKPATEAAGMRYVNIPMSDKKRPSDTQIEEFLALTQNKEEGPFYIHCKGGRHRTGVMGAVYRYNYDKWTYEQVYREMKDYDYYSRWGHGALGDYVKDYYQSFQTRSVNTSSGAASSN